jgi:hypothetical protein
MFSVFKPESAMGDLLSAWKEGDGYTRAAIELAMLGLERRLQENPHEHGESRGEGTRVLFLHPLAITVEVDDARRMVRLVRAWTFRRQAA